MVVLLKKEVPMPSGVHWIGDAGAEKDAKACVLYFDTQGQCIDFMNWITAVSERKRVSEAMTFKEDK